MLVEAHNWIMNKSSFETPALVFQLLVLVSLKEKWHLAWIGFCLMGENFWLLYTVVCGGSLKWTGKISVFGFHVPNNFDVCMVSGLKHESALPCFINRHILCYFFMFILIYIFKPSTLKSHQVNMLFNIICIASK